MLLSVSFYLRDNHMDVWVLKEVIIPDGEEYQGEIDQGQLPKKLESEKDF